MDEITLIIKTHERPKALSLLLKSISEHANIYQIIIADDSDKDGRQKTLRMFPELRITYLSIPNYGINFGRTLAAKFSKTEFIVLLDDDFEFTSKTDLMRQLKYIKSSNVDLICGLISEFPDYSLISIIGMIKDLIVNKNVSRFYNYLFNKAMVGAWINFREGNETRFLKYNDLLEEQNYSEISYGPNFFVVRKKTLEDIGYWDSEDIPPYDHSNFFKKMTTFNKVMKLDYEFHINHISKRNLKYYFRRNFN